jgi:hypothetical protein
MKIKEATVPFHDIRVTIFQGAKGCWYSDKEAAEESLKPKREKTSKKEVQSILQEMGL